MPIYAIGDRAPDISPTAFVHPDAVIIGDVRLGPESSVWPATVLRGDHGAIIVGARTSVQDGTIVHCTAREDTVIGDGCVIGHRVHLEGCRIDDGCLVGSGAVVLNGARLHPGAMVAAQGLVPPRMEVPAGALARGVPARIVEGGADADLIEHATSTYVRNAHWYNADLRRLD